TGVWTAPNWTIGSLASGATETITIEAVVGVGTGGTTLVNTVSNTQDQTDDNTTPDDASESVTVTSSDLVTIKVVNILTPDEGDGIVYTITVSNIGSDATGVSLTDNLPAGVTYVSDDSAGAYNSGSGIWTIGAIADGATVTLNITATVNAGTSGQTITNVTTAATGDQTDPDATTDTLSADILVNIFSDIVLTKVVDNATPNTGDTVTYTVTVTNNGAAAVTNLVVTDALPMGLTFGSATPSSGTWTAPNWTIGNLARGASESITIEALVVAAGTIPSITLTNIVTNTQDQIDTNVTLDDSTADIVVTASNLVTTKVVDNATPNEGETIVYTIEVSNAGSDATGVSLTDNLPAGVTYISDDSLGAYNSGSGIWTIGAIADGATATLNITATVNAGTSGDDITNFTTAAMGDQSDPTTDGDDLSELITVANNADIVLTKVVDNNSPNEGDTITYTVTVTNNGPAAVTNLVIADALGAGLTFGLVTPSTGTWSSPNWTIGSLAPGATETITIEAVVGVGTGGTTLTNTVSNTQDQTDDNTTPDDASESVTVTSSDLETLKTVSDASPNEGNIITYTITVTNNGLSDATSVSLVDNLPVGVTYVSHSTSDGVFNNGSGVWSIGSLAYGDTATLTIDASVDAGTVGVTITNTTSAVIADQSDPNISNNIGSVSIVPVAFIDLSLTKTIVNNITAPLVGDQITFEIRVNNEGPTDASGVQVTDLIPSGYEFVNYSSTIGGYDPISGVWHIGNVEIGNMAVLLVDVIVLESGDYTNCAEITAANEDDVDSTPNSGNDGEDDYACALTVPVNEADLSITKTVVANNVTPLVDTEVTFEIRITNNGPLDATEVIVTDMLPDGYTFVNYSSTIGTYSEVSGLWTIGTILNGETEVLLIDVIVNATGEYENCTSITNLRQIDPNPSNDSDCASTTPIPVADLELTKDVDNLLPYAETNVDFTIVVTNNGPSEATGVVVTDLLPSGYTFVSYSATAGTYDAGSGLWNIGSVINGESVTLTVTAYVLPIGDWTNVAEVTAANELDLDSTPGNNDIYEDDQAQVTTAPIILLTMPEGFSPDGDGINDVFEIEFLEVLYPNFSMQIVNRYGNKVYEYQHNGNPNTTPLWWDGFSNGRWNLDSLELPTGTYFYTIYFNNDERKPQTGWIYLRR
ncbi:gliding motility-associated C-terminal domain-containing protein, partial [Lutibacter sp.]|uniref:T9SS type B sorting domain-containing protein n=1 Tax=Lutibacter sp. TaxID=1925666 RepID=UPI0035674BC3